jgi:DNA-binding CsgD family transcriptional regulator
METREAGAMELTAVVTAVEVLLSPLEWGGRDAWLGESARLVRAACGGPEPVSAGNAAGDAVTELETLLGLPDDPPRWLRAALDDPDADPCPLPLPAPPPGATLPLEVLSLRCALAAGLATYHRLSPALPTTQELRIHFGLRGREPQVALLAAEGLSNADIAQRLRLSAHTVRHYLERVMDRLGLHTRKRLAMHLMGGGAERARPERGRRGPS